MKAEEIVVGGVYRGADGEERRVHWVGMKNEVMCVRYLAVGKKGRPTQIPRDFFAEWALERTDAR
jgi:hypothetical protein